MPAAKDFYVAIELGSSKITGIAGQKKMDGSITVLAIATEQSALCIRRGVVYNIDKTNQCIRNIIQKLQTQLQTEITLVHVGIGGQGVCSLVNTISNDFDEATVVSHNIIDRMMDANRATRYSSKTILDVAPQEFKVDSQFQFDPVGIECNRIEGHFLNILWRDSFCQKFNKCFEQAGMPEPRYYLAPMALADNILTDSERRGGCVLVDMGAGTTTVSVYYKNILRHMATVPMGGWNVTKDITSFHIDEMEAEKLKIKYASACINPKDVDAETKYPIDQQRYVSQRDFVSVVEARVEEIVKNAIAQIPSEYADKLPGGIILTGGAAMMKNMEQAFRQYSDIDKVRIAKTVNSSVNYAKGVKAPEDAMLCTVLSLLLKSDQKSSGRSLDEIHNLFGQAEIAAPDAGGPRPLTEFPAGQVPTGRDLKAAEEERQRKEEEDRKRQEEEEVKRQEEEERKRKENSFSSRFKKGMMKIFNEFTKPEEE